MRDTMDDIAVRGAAMVQPEEAKNNSVPIRAMRNGLADEGRSAGTTYKTIGFKICLSIGK